MPAVTPAAYFSWTQEQLLRPDPPPNVLAVCLWPGQRSKPETVALNHFAYNFCKIHTSLQISPARAAGVTNRLMHMSELVAMLAESEADKAA